MMAVLCGFHSPQSPSSLNPSIHVFLYQILAKSVAPIQVSLSQLPNVTQTVATSRDIMLRPAYVRHASQVCLKRAHPGARRFDLPALFGHLFYLFFDLSLIPAALFRDTSGIKSSADTMQSYRSPATSSSYSSLASPLNHSTLNGGLRLEEAARRGDMDR